MVIREISNFLSVCEYMNLSKAADFLGISQPALSREIKLLEQRLGIKLFFRRPRGLDLTPEGRIYLESFRKIDLELKSAYLRAKELHTSLAGHFKISIHPILGKYIIPKFEKEIAKLESITTEYIFQNSRKSVDQVLNCEVDLAIAADVQDYPDIVKIPLWSEYVGLYSKDGQIKNTLLYNFSMINARRILAKYSKAEVREIGDYHVLYSILKKNNFMGLLPNPIVDNEKKVKLITKFQPTIYISMVFRSDRVRTQSLKRVIQIFKAQAKAY